MKALLCCLALCGCARTTLYDPATGHRILQTGANAKVLRYRNGSTTLVVLNLDHSTPTEAGGHSAAQKITALGGALTAAGVTALMK